MRRWVTLGVACFVLATIPARAQMGKRITILAGTLEDKALAEISAASDPAQKLALIDKFLADYGQGDMAVVAYEQYVAFHLAQKNYDKVFEYGEKLLAADPDDFAGAVNLVRAAQEKGDTAKLFEIGERVGAIVSRYKAKPAPEGVEADAWAQEKARTLEQIHDNLNYVAYALFSVAYQTPDPAARAGLLERFVAAFADLPLATNGQALLADTYQQAQNYPKMLETAQKILARDANHIGMLLLLSDYYSERGQELDKAEGYAKKALDLLGSATKPEGVTDEQWQKQLALQKGLAWSALGQVFINRNNLPQAVEAFKTANPLLHDNAVSYGRNLYRLGFTLALMKRTAEARTVLTEAVSVDSPYRPLAQETLNKLGGTRRPAKRP